MKIKPVVQKCISVEKQMSSNNKKSEKGYVQAIAKVLACAGKNHNKDANRKKSHFTNGAKLKEELVACYKKRGRHKKEPTATPTIPSKGKTKNKKKEINGKGLLPQKGKGCAPAPSRVRRMASLNALAKVHILYENESRLGPNEGVENSTGVVPDEKKFKALVPIKKEPKEQFIVSKNSTNKSNCKTLEKYHNKKVAPLPSPPPATTNKKKRNRKHPSDVEIIDTRVCRRLASLNAQAILAASYSVERSRREKRDSKVCFDKEILTYDHKISSITTKTTCTYFQKQAEAKQGEPAAGSTGSSRSEPKRTKEKARCEPVKQPQGSVGKVGMTHYTEVTQVHMTKEMAVKEEVKAKRTIERFLEKDDVEITRMYRYQSKGKSESYCLQMHTTYQPLPATPPSDFSLPESPLDGARQPPPPLQQQRNAVNDVGHSPGHGSPYYGYSPPPPVIANGQNFPVVGPSSPGSVTGIPMVNSMARHYGSAFTVPHYGSPSAVSYPSGDYGYYQPAGGIGRHEQCTIHKPVPYHPQHIHSPPPAHHHHHRHRSSPHLPPPPAHNPFPQDSQCIPHHGYSQQQQQQPYPQEPSQSYAPVSPYHCPSPNVQRCMYSSQPGNYHQDYHATNYQVMSPVPAGPKSTCPPAPSPHQINAVPKTEPTTPPELKPNGYGSPFATYNPGLASDLPPLIREDCSPPNGRCPEFCQQCRRRDIAIADPGTKTPVRGSCRTSVKSHRQQKEPPAIDDATSPGTSSNLEMVRKGRSPSSSTSSESGGKTRRGSGNGQAKKSSSSTLAPPPAKKTRKSLSPEAEVAPAEPPVQIPRPGLGGCSGKKKAVKRFSNGWSWEGEPFEKLVFLCNDDVPCLRKCFPAMRHIEGDTIGIRDCVLLKSGPRKIDLPFVAKVTALWETPEEGEMMMSLMWYYRPEHTEQGRRSQDVEAEIFASKHRDVNSVACIEDKCYVLTFSEYCRYKANMKMLEENVRRRTAVVPERDDPYLRRLRMPPGRISLEMVFFCRRVYDFRQKRILKNPT